MGGMNACLVRGVHEIERKMRRPTLVAAGLSCANDTSLMRGPPWVQVAWEQSSDNGEGANCNDE
jgi:hypothetical protein